MFRIREGAVILHFGCGMQVCTPNVSLGRFLRVARRAAERLKENQTHPNNSIRATIELTQPLSCILSKSAQVALCFHREFDEFLLKTDLDPCRNNMSHLKSFKALNISSTLNIEH
jgi:hypothetical protein